MIHTAERARPEIGGEPGCLRVDMVYQGDQNGEKGAYYIKAVGEVIQWEITATAIRIAEYCLVQALEDILEGFPLCHQGFSCG